MDGNIAIVSLGLSQRMTTRDDLAQWPSHHRVERHGQTGWWFVLWISDFLKWRVWHNFVEKSWGHHLPQRATGSELGDKLLSYLHDGAAAWPFHGRQFPHLQSAGLDWTVSKNTFGFCSPLPMVRSGLFSSTCPLFLLWPREQHSNKLEPPEICPRIALACSLTFILFTDTSFLLVSSRGFTSGQLGLKSDSGNLVFDSPINDLMVLVRFFKSCDYSWGLHKLQKECKTELNKI